MSLPAHRSSGSFVFVPATVLEWAPAMSMVLVIRSVKNINCRFWILCKSMNEALHLVEVFPKNEANEQLHGRLQVWQVTPLPLQLHVIQHHQHRLTRPDTVLERQTDKLQRPEAKIIKYIFLKHTFDVQSFQKSLFFVHVSQWSCL